MVPELISTNRQILEQMQNLNKAHEESRAAALAAEDRHVAGLEAAAQQNREAHERSMNLFREALNPHAQAIAAMHAGAASLHTAAQDIRSAATMHRAMAAESSNLFVAAVHQGLEAIRAQRPDQAPMAGPQQQPSVPLAGPEVQTVTLDEVIDEEHARPARNLRAAARSASRGAASSGPATQETEETAGPYGKAIAVDFGRGRSSTPSRGRSPGRRNRSRSAKKVVVVEPHDESGAVITGEPNSIVRVESQPKERLKPPAKQQRTATRSPAARASAAVQIVARSPSAPRVKARSPSLARKDRGGVRQIALDG